MLLHIRFLVCLNSRLVSAPVLKANGVRGQDGDAATGEGWAESLQGITHQAGDFTFAEVSLTGMLVMNQHGGKGPAAIREQEIGRDAVTFVAGVADQDSAITGFFRNLMRCKWHWGLDDVEA